MAYWALPLAGLAVTAWQVLFPYRVVSTAKGAHKPKTLTLIQDGAKYPNNVGGYYRFGHVLDGNLELVVVERENHYINDKWFLKAKNGSTGHLTKDKVKVVFPEERDELIKNYLADGVFVGVLENIPITEDGTPPISLHSKEFSDIVNSNDRLVFVIGHESSGTSPEVLANKQICPLTIETHGSSKRDSSLGVFSVVCTLLNQVKNYTLNPI